MAEACNLTVSYKESTGEIGITKIVKDEEGNCFAVEDIVRVPLEVAHRLMNSLHWALEAVGYLPTDADFEAFRQKILEDS